MRKFSVNLVTTASAIVTVTVSDEKLAEVALDLGKEVGELTPDDLRDHVTYRAHERAPYICAQCSGWGREDQSLELGDEWELPTDQDGAEDDGAVWEVTGE